MSAMDEKADMTNTTVAEVQPPTANVLTITRPTPSRHTSGAIAVMSTIEDIDSTHSLTPTQTIRNEKSLDGDSQHFYNHQNSESKQNITVQERCVDLEAQNLSHMSSRACLSQTGLVKNKTRCDPAWPDREELKMRRKAFKRDQACCRAWSSMSKTKRGIITTVIVLLVLGAAIGIGLGISRNIGGGTVTKQGANTPLPS